MRVNVWIRKENERVWQDMDNKSEWLNEMLVRETSPLPNMPRISKPVTAILKNFSETLDGKKVTIDHTPISEPARHEPKIVNVPASSFCEHGQLKGQCLQKKCKYGRGA